MKTVLYIEDNKFNVELISQIISGMEGVRFICEMDGPSGLARALQELPDLILLDINLPGMNGREVLKKLKAEKTAAHIPVIALSADALESQIRDSLAMGFTDYITKPIDLDNFLDTIEKILSE